MNTYINNITYLEQNEVFVFGSNLNGFHGAGAAGYATFNEFGNLWRKYNYDKQPNGTLGKWNIKGVGLGYQKGIIGSSYAIPTITFPGYKKSIPLHTIKDNITEFYKYALDNSEKKFYIAYFNKTSNGYLITEMASIFYNINIPENVFFNKNFAKLIIKQ